MLPLPITPDDFVARILTPALQLLPAYMDSPEARVLVTAICIQESDLAHRWQVLNSGNKGPARGLPQFEQGGVRGVYRHRASSELLRQLCRDRDVSFDPRAIWAQLEHDDVLAVGLARLLVWTDPLPLPAVDDLAGSWALYADRLWRPGKPHPDKWPRSHRLAREAVLGVEAL